MSLALAMLIPCIVLWLECSVALAKPASPPEQGGPSPTLAVLVPAHNEALVIQRTLAQLLPQIKAQDSLVVVADNCTDATAELARAAGAVVIERRQPEQRGKGYALDFGLRHLSAAVLEFPPEIVVVIDADCQVMPETIAQLAQRAIATQRPVQAAYLFQAAANPTPKAIISLFANRVRNLVRPLGLARLRQPCLLLGTGMAFPWAAINSVNLANGNIVEDLKLGLDLAIAGYPPVYCASARVTSQQPQNQRTATTQRTRWEHGHLQTLLEYGPTLVLAALQQRRADLLSLALELCVPPLSLLVLLWSSLTAALTATALFSGFWLAAGLSYLAGGLLLSAIWMAWYGFARQEVSLRQLLSVPLYILWKIPLYLKFLTKPESQWIRTERGD